tara:strand:+ start:51949 stop:52758 length:810 start_codon:yes stop_codon:yes gene_type:complete
MYRLPKFLPLLFVMLTTSTGSAHDVWVNTHTPIVRTGENVYIDLRLGNHGNHHRDFKLAGRITLDWVSLDHIAPGGQRTDIKGKMFATASAEKEGYWTTPLAVHQPGVHCVVESLDRVMNHGKSIRSIRTAKTYFLVSDSLDSAKVDRHVHQKPLGLPLELVMQTCPFSETVAGSPITVQVLHQGKPLADAVVAFIPEGTELAGEFDSEYEFRSDSDGMVTFVPKTGNRHLIVAHYTAMDERSDDYEFTSYASTITIDVPNSHRVADHK